MKIGTRIFGVCICLATLTGCPQWFFDFHTRRQVSFAEIVGEWELTAESLDLVRRDSGYAPPTARKHSIHLLATGRFQRTTIIETDARVPKYVSDEGQWHLNYDKDKKRNELSVVTDGGHGSFMNFGVEAGALTMWSYWSDPDEGALLRYRKMPNQALEPTTPAVTIPAAQEVAPAGVVAHL